MLHAAIFDAAIDADDAADFAEPAARHAAAAAAISMPPLDCR
jgi:hypothetical protein